MRLDKIIARGRIIDLRSLDLEGALKELLDACVAKFPDLKPESLLTMARAAAIAANAWSSEVRPDQSRHCPGCAALTT